jgi:PST family polysaccharide transporter
MQLLSSSLFYKGFSHTHPFFSNFASLSLVNVLNYLLPIISIPYLVRILGPERFGLIAFSQSCMFYLILVTDFGFALSATKQISINKGNSNAVSNIFWSVMFIKIALLILSGCCLIGLTVLAPRFRLEQNLFLISFGIVFGSVIFPTWFFQGMEEMKYIALGNIISRLIYTGGLFIFVRTKQDYLMLAILNSAGNIIAGVVGLWIVRFRFGVQFLFPRLDYVSVSIKEGWHLFISSVSSSMYTQGNTILLGLMTNNTIVGQYAGADRLVKVVLNGMSPIFQAIFPYYASLSSQSPASATVLMRKVAFFTVPLALAVSLTLLICAPSIILLVLGRDFVASIPVLRAQAFVPLAVAISSMALQFMVVRNQTSILALVYVIAGAIGATSLILLSPVLHALGAGLSILMAEFFVAIALLSWILYRDKIIDMAARHS